jgi:hypothetical protein
MSVYCTTGTTQICLYLKLYFPSWSVRSDARECPVLNICTVYSLLTLVFTTSRFWPRVRARALRAPVFLGALPRQTGRCAPSAHRSCAASYYRPKNINLLFPETRSFLQARARTARVEYLSTGPSRL